jgi:hypothetical protein
MSRVLPSLVSPKSRSSPTTSSMWRRIRLLPSSSPLAPPSLSLIFYPKLLLRSATGQEVLGLVSDRGEIGEVHKGDLLELGVDKVERVLGRVARPVSDVASTHRPMTDGERLGEEREYSIIGCAQGTLIFLWVLC